MTTMLRIIIASVTCLTACCLVSCSILLPVYIANHQSEAITVTLVLDDEVRANAIERDTIWLYNEVTEYEELPESTPIACKVKRLDSTALAIDIPPKSTVHIGSFLNSTRGIRRIRVGDCELQAPYDCAFIESRHPVLGRHYLMYRYGYR